MPDHPSKQEGVTLGQYTPPHLRNRAKKSQDMATEEDSIQVTPTRDVTAVVEKSGYTPPHLRNRPKHPDIVANPPTVDVLRSTKLANEKAIAAKANLVAQPHDDVVHQKSLATSSTVQERTQSIRGLPNSKQNRTATPSTPLNKVKPPNQIESFSDYDWVTLNGDQEMASQLLRDLQLKVEQAARDGSASRASSHTRGSPRANRTNSTSNGRRSSNAAHKQVDSLTTHSVTANNAAIVPASSQANTKSDAIAAGPVSRPTPPTAHPQIDSTTPTADVSAQVFTENGKLHPANARDSLGTNQSSWVNVANGSTLKNGHFPPLCTADAGISKAPALPPAVKWWSTYDNGAQIQPVTPSLHAPKDAQPQAPVTSVAPIAEENYEWINADLPISREEFEKNYSMPSRGRGGGGGGGRGRGSPRGRGSGGRGGGRGNGRVHATNQQDIPEPPRRSQWPKKSAKEAAKVREDWKDGVYAGSDAEDFSKHREKFAKEARLGNINSFDNDIDEEWILGGFAGQIAEEQLREKLEEEDEWGAIRHLCDWDGGWGPPPLDWQERNRYRRRNMYAVVYEWVALSEAAQGTILEGDPAVVKDLRKRIKKPAININHRRFLGTRVSVHDEEAITNSTIAPRYWIPESIDDEEIDTWWDTRGNRCPGPDDADDIAAEHEPFWHTYGQDSRPYLKTHVHPHPDECVMDPADEDYDLYKTHPTSDLWAGRAIRRLKKEKEPKRRPLYRTIEERDQSVREVRAILAAERLEEEERMRVREKEQIEEVKVAIEQLEPIAEETKPASTNMYVRPANDADLLQIMEIWNWYQERTVYVPEHEPFTLDQVQQRVQDITAEKCPFFVAVQKGQKQKGKRNKNACEETILGFAFADRTHTLDGMYRGCAEIEIFIDDKHTMSGLGTKLLEQVIAVCDPDYTRRQECEFRVPADLTFRRFVNFLLLLPSETEMEHAREIWVGKWLGTAFGFKYTGKYEMMGARRGRWVDQSHYQLRCKGFVDPREFDG